LAGEDGIVEALKLCSDELALGHFAGFRIQVEARLAEFLEDFCSTV